MNTAYIDRRNTNAEIFRRANLAVETRQGNDTRLNCTIWQCRERIKLTGHLLRADQVSFQNSSGVAVPLTCLCFAGLVDPQKNRMISSIEFCWNKCRNSRYTNFSIQQRQLLAERQKLFKWCFLAL